MPWDGVEHVVSYQFRATDMSYSMVGLVQDGIVENVENVKVIGHLIIGRTGTQYRCHGNFDH